jgi:tRNA dimethylallyltransferase
MLDAGWIEEVRTLRRMGYAPGSPALSAHGYPELRRVLEGEWPLAEARERIIQVTYAFVRRQLTWFRSEGRLQWLDADAPRLGEQVIAAWQQFLHNRKLTT